VEFVSDRVNTLHTHSSTFVVPRVEYVIINAKSEIVDCLHHHSALTFAMG